MQQQAVFRNRAPPFAHAFRTEFSEGRRRRCAAPPQHFLKPDAFIDSHARRLHHRRQKPAPQRALFRVRRELMPVHVRNGARRKRLLPIQQNPQRQAVISHNGDRFQIAPKVDARVLKQALRVSPGALRDGRNLAQAGRVVVAHDQSHLSRTCLHSKPAVRPGEDPPQHRLVPAPFLNFDCPLEQRREPF